MTLGNGDQELPGPLAAGSWWRLALRPLASRKVRVALATIIAAIAAEYGLGVSEEIVLTLVSVGVAMILGIAHEDAGRAGRTEGTR